MTVLFRHILLLSVCLFGAINSAHAQPQEELSSLRKQIAGLQKELEKTTESQSEAVNELRSSERAVSGKRKLSGLTLQLRAAAQAA